mmetsp:Transcript_2976/g.7262  ORF Transcript_2976/g.7262 Transcript_2976/m.7262 type:complete len:250 (+) Transcript_2976:1150-1899(+)
MRAISLADLEAACSLMMSEFMEIDFMNSQRIHGICWDCARSGCVLLTSGSELINFLLCLPSPSAFRILCACVFRGCPGRHFCSVRLDFSCWPTWPNSCPTKESLRFRNHKFQESIKGASQLHAHVAASTFTCPNHSRWERRWVSHHHNGVTTFDTIVLDRRFKRLHFHERNRFGSNTRDGARFDVDTLESFNQQPTVRLPGIVENQRHGCVKIHRTIFNTVNFVQGVLCSLHATAACHSSSSHGGQVPG